MNDKTDMIPVPIHLQTAIIDIVAPLTEEGLDTEDQIFWAAIRKVKTVMGEQALVLYQTALLALKETAQSVRARIMFDDERLNYILDNAVLTTEAKVVMPKPDDFGFEWIRYDGDKTVHYRLSLMGKPIRILHNGKMLDVRTVQVMPMEQPITEPLFTTSDPILKRIVLEGMLVNEVSDSLLPDAQLALIRSFKRHMEAAIEKGGGYHLE